MAEPVYFRMTIIIQNSSVLNVLLKLEFAFVCVDFLERQLIQQRKYTGLDIW